VQVRPGGGLGTHGVVFHPAAEVGWHQRTRSVVVARRRQCADERRPAGDPLGAGVLLQRHQHTVRHARVPGGHGEQGQHRLVLARAAVAAEEAGARAHVLRRPDQPVGVHEPLGGAWAVHQRAEPLGELDLGGGEIDRLPAGA
jgi:hypothetical protein